MKSLITFVLLGVLVAACKVSPKEIPYGNAECAYCRMNIVDQQHAAELVTSKGKVFYFDAIECMANFKVNGEESDYAHLLVNNYLEPGKLIPVSGASFLISKQIPSPMGANLSAFSGREFAEKAKKESGGKIYNWNEIVELARSREF